MRTAIHKGSKFSRLKVLREAERDKYGHPRWLCLCECGKRCLAIQSELQSGHKKSCGCLQYSGASNFRHGFKRKGRTNRTYQCWVNMKRRCTNPSIRNWQDYGGRGITYDPRWEKFENFLSDMGEIPDKLTIDRIDNNGPYAKWNCQWTDRHTQRLNQDRDEVTERYPQIKIERVNRLRVGARFGRLIVQTVLDGRSKCLCDCGNLTTVHNADLYKNSTRSCGCLLKENPSNLRHGFTRMSDRKPSNPKWKAWCAWSAMKKRCDNSNVTDFQNYGGRGITYDPSWKDFETFISDMGLPPNEKSTLERKDNDGNYSKDNCIWSDRKAQSRNRRMRRELSLNGVSKPMWKWAEDLGLKSSRILRVRLNRGWSVERTLTEGF